MSRHRKGPQRRVLRRPWVEDVVTSNDDFTNAHTSVMQLLWRWLWRGLAARNPLAVLIQEGKATRYRRVVGRRHGVRQYDDNDGTRGSVVVWDRYKAMHVGGNAGTRGLGHGIAPMLPTRRGVGMHTRYIVWQDVLLLPRRHRANMRAGAKGVRRARRYANRQVRRWRRGKPTRIVRLASVHAPPARYDRHRPEYEDNLRGWLDACPVQTIVGTDANTKALEAYGRRVRTEVRGHHIDALQLRGSGLSFVGKTWVMPRLGSDHNPVSVPVRIGTTSRR